MSASDSTGKSRRMILPQSGPALIGVIVVAVVAFSLGGLFFGGDEPADVDPQAGHDHAQESASEPSVWTCSMHPQFQLPKPGKCPICFMDLIPLDQGDTGELDPRQLRMSEAARQLARIETTPALKAFAEREVRMVGRVGYDETSVASITAWVPGRLDRLHADYTGITVNKGDPLVSIYSPELLAAQEELIQAKAAISAIEDTRSRVLRSTAEATLEAVREKLRLFGLATDQIEEIESSGVTSDHLTINAPIGGVVVHKDAREGMYVKTGTRIYTIADLSRLWVLFEAYESDLPWLRIGQSVEFTSQSFPGETFEAAISFIDPIVNPKTRTTKIRAVVENMGLRLKPDMFVSGMVPSRVYNNGEVADEDAPILIPVTAPMLTGKRAVVYVEVPNDEGPLFEGREVQLGPRAGEFYVVKSGIAEGELVVTNGAFKIDAELQIQAKPSMMSPEGGVSPMGHDHGSPMVAVGESHEQHDQVESSLSQESESVRQALMSVYDAYFGVQMALANDNHSQAKESAGQLAIAVAGVDMGLFSHAGHNWWMEIAASLRTGADQIVKSEDIEGARDSFYHLSQTAISLHDSFGHAGDQEFYLTFCPMARNNTGAHWLQTEDIIWNSYFGDAMLRCGEIQKTLPATTVETE